MIRLPYPVPRPDYPKRGEQVVYCFYGEYGEILYIGVTQNFPQRMKQHKSSKAWIGEVELMNWIVCPDRAQAEEYEAHCIDELNPKYNVARLVPYVDYVNEALKHPRYQELREMQVEL